MKTRKKEKSQNVLSKEESRIKFSRSIPIPSESKQNNTHSSEDDINLDEIDNFLDEEAKQRINDSSFQPTELNAENLFYKLRNKTTEFKFDETNGKFRCPFCKTVVKNIKIHFDKHPSCGNRIDMDHFKI